VLDPSRAVPVGCDGRLVAVVVNCRGVGDHTDNGLKAVILLSPHLCRHMSEWQEDGITAWASAEFKLYFALTNGYRVIA
jgi:hypothetical protein